MPKISAQIPVCLPSKKAIIHNLRWVVLWKGDESHLFKDGGFYLKGLFVLTSQIRRKKKYYLLRANGMSVCWLQWKAQKVIFVLRELRD